MPVVGGVDRELLGARRDHAALIGLDERAEPCREHEDMRAAAQRQHQRQLRPVDEEAGPELVHSCLQKSGGRICVRHASCREERENGADRHVDVDAGGAVERIKGDGERRAAVEQHRLLQFFGRIERDRRMPHGVEEDVVGEDVEVLLVVAGGVGAARTCEGGAQRAVADRVADLDRCFRELADGRCDGRVALTFAANVRVQKGIERRRGHCLSSSGRTLIGRPAWGMRTSEGG